MRREHGPAQHNDSPVAPSFSGSAIFKAGAVEQRSASHVASVPMPDEFADGDANRIFKDVFDSLAAVVAALAGFSLGVALITLYFLSSRAFEILRNFLSSSVIKRHQPEKEPEPPHLRDRPDCDNNAG